MSNEENENGFISHLTELRKRLIHSFLFLFLFFIGCYFFAENIYGFLVDPFAKAVKDDGTERRLIFTALQETFLTYLKVSFFTAFFVTCPFILMQIWKFIAPGLYKHEKIAIMPYLILTPILFLLGGMLVYYLIMPLAIKFFLSFESTGLSTNLPIQLEAKVNEYLSLVMKLIFAFGLSFQLPVVLSLLARVGIVDSQFLKDRRKYVVVIIFAAAAFLTYLKVSFFAAFFVTCPYILMQVWKFIAPGLYKHEKTAILPYLILTPILFLLGGMLVYYLIMPLAIKFFLSFESSGASTNLPIQLEAKVNEYLSLVMKLIFAFGISFQLPVVLSLLARVGVVDSEFLKKRRKYVVVIIFAAAAILTPPDPITQIGLAIPLLILYELSIFSVNFIEKKHLKDSDA